MKSVFLLGLTLGVFAQAQTPAATPPKPVGSRALAAASKKPTIADVREWMDRARSTSSI
jgi:hypothetical protein